MADLRYIDDAGCLRVGRLGAEHFLIGRTNTCQIVFVDDMVSREHARLDRDPDGRYRVRDLGSRNKTFVNGQQVPEALLASGDVLRVGEHVLEFLDEESRRGRLELDFLTPDRSDPPGSEWVKIKAPVTLSLEQLGNLGGTAALFGPTMRAEDIAEAALSRLLLDLQAERGFIARRGEQKGEIVPIAQRGLALQPGGSRMPVSQTFVLAAVLQQVAGRYPQQASQIDPKIGFAATALVAPLVHRNDVVGLIYVDRATARQPFSTMALQYITAAGSMVGGMMAEASRRLLDASGISEAGWMAAVRRLQASINAVPEVRPPFELAWKTRAGSCRCGDLCDLMPAGDGRCVALLVDGGGNGVASLSQAASIRAGIRAAVERSGDVLDLGPIFDSLNRTVASQGNRQLVSCAVLGIDLAAGRIAYVNAGCMPPLLLVGPGRLITLDQPSLVLGVDADYRYDSSSADLPPSWRLVCHTDGLTNAANASGEVFGESRLHELLLSRESFADVATALQRIDAAISTHLSGHAHDDDATMLVVGKG